MDSLRMALLGIIGALGAFLGMMETILPIPIGLVLMYIFQENRKEVVFSILAGKLFLLLEAILCWNMFYATIFLVTSLDEMAGVMVFSRATCIDNKTLIATGTVATFFQNALVVVCMFPIIDTMSDGILPIDTQMFTFGVLIPMIVIGAICYGFCFVFLFKSVKGVLDDIRAVIVPYTSKVQELNNLTDYV